MMRWIICLPLFWGLSLMAQTDYTNLTNWYFHPGKFANILANWELDIAVIDKDLSVVETINFPNRSTEDTGVDIFWVHPTQLLDAPTFPTTIPIDEQPFSVILPTILAQGGLLAQYGRFYAPRYQQASPAAFLDAGFPEVERTQALMAAYSDVKAAFLHYLENHNNGNKIILAGHSQGSYHLAMLLRDVFDPSPALREQLLTAALAGMAYTYADVSSLSGGWWENIPLCSSVDQCGCVHTWRSFKETQFIPNVSATALPPFNELLVDSGLVYRNMDVTSDRVIADSLYYGTDSSPLRYYITPSAGYDLGVDANYLAFEGMYTARMRRESALKAVLAVDYVNDPMDMRPNDLLPVENQFDFLFMGFHQKDYHIYQWALMEQINEKLTACTSTSSSNFPSSQGFRWDVFPNPSYGKFTVRLQDANWRGEPLEVFTMAGQLLKTIDVEAEQAQFSLNASGVYLLKMGSQYRRIIVR